MDDTIKQLPFDQLRTLHRDIGALIAERRAQELDRLRTQISILGFSPSDLLPDKPKKRGRPRKPEENGEDLHAG